MGDFIRSGLKERLAGQTGIQEIRGKGLMVGIDLDRPCGELVQAGLQRGLLINVTADTVVRLLPPLILRAAEAAQLIDGVADVIREFLGEPATVAIQG
jgi:acetylornithine aminotransferase